MATRAKLVQERFSSRSQAFQLLSTGRNHQNRLIFTYTIVCKQQSNIHITFTILTNVIPFPKELELLVNEYATHSFHRGAKYKGKKINCIRFYRCW